MTRLAAPILDSFSEQPGSNSTQLLGGLGDRGEVDPAHPSQGNVVVARYRQLPGYVDPRLIGNLEHSDRSEVVRGDNGRRRWCPFQQAFHAGPTAAAGEGPTDHVDFGAETVVAHLRLVAFPPPGTTGGFARRNVSDPGMTKPHEMINQHGGTKPIVVCHGVHQRRCGWPAHDHDRSRSGCCLEAIDRPDVAKQNQSVGPQLDEGIDGGALPFGVEKAGAQQGPVPGGDRLFLDAIGDVGKEGIVEVGDHHSEHAGTAASQRSGGGVGAVVELTSGVEHRFAAFLADVGRTTHHERYERLGYSGPLGHVMDGWMFWLRPCHGRQLTSTLERSTELVLWSAGGDTADMEPPSFSLAGRVAVVTGAGRGIGRGLATSLAAAGASVAVAGRDLDALSELAAEIEADGGTAWPVHLDVTDIADIDAAFDRVRNHFGSVDILVNNAGLGANHPAEDVTEADWDEIMNVNLKGLFFCCRAAGRIMLQQGAGRIVNLSSQAGVVGIRDHAVYSASKGGVNLLTKVLALEWSSRGVNVNAVAPTFIYTPGTAERLDQPDYLAGVLERIPAGKVGSIDDVAGAVIYLASPAADMVTGHVLVVDGGWTAQ